MLLSSAITQSRFRTFPSTQKAPCLSCLASSCPAADPFNLFALLHLPWASGSSCFLCWWSPEAVSWDLFNPFPGSWLREGIMSPVPLKSKESKTQFPYVSNYKNLYPWAVQSSDCLQLISIQLNVLCWFFALDSIYVITNHQCVEKEKVMYLGFNCIIVREALKTCSQRYVWNSNT